MRSTDIGPGSPPPGGPHEGPGRRPSGPALREVLEGVSGELAASGIDTPDVDSLRLVASALGIDVPILRADLERRIGPAEAGAIARAVGRRLAGEPLQHIEGSVEFRGLELVCDRRALIPRPETEQLIDLVAATVASPLPRVLDVGIGSGAIALALLEEGLAREVVGLDRSTAALALARENAARTGLAERLTLRTCGAAVFDAVASEPPFDALVSNPPYVRSGEIPELQTEVRDHEPVIALDGGADGLEVIRTIVAGAGSALRKDAWAFLEIGADQGPAVTSLFDAAPGWGSPRLATDLSGRTRFAAVRWHGRN